MSVSEGIGKDGRNISGYITDNLPRTLNFTLFDENKNVNEDNVSDVIKNVFLDTNKQLTGHGSIESAFSGSTMISIIHTPEKLIIANLGNCRAVMARLNDKGK